MTVSELLLNIEELRTELLRSIENNQRLTDTEVLAANRNVNIAIVKYYKLFYKNHRLNNNGI